jgi:hypothetical protein
MKSILILLSLVFSSVAFAVDIASCSNPSGTSYFPELGIVTKKNSGWTDDKVTGGITKLSKIGKDQYDIVFVDTTKRIVSSTEDGGRVLMLNRGNNVVSFMVIYPGQTAEIYTFLKNNSGALEYIQVTSRAGDAVMIAKATIMRGNCEFIDFNKL